MALVLVSAASLPQSIVFTGTLGTPSIDYDRVTIPITGGVTANLANTDCTFEIWIKPHATSNDNTGANWYDGNIFVDRDSFAGSPTGGQWGMSILGGVVALGIGSSTGATVSYTTLTATTDITDDAWHHIVWTFDISTGNVELWVDGTREINSSVSIASGGNLGLLSGGDAKAQLIELGGEKNDQESGDSLSFFGSMSEILMSSSLLYTGASISVPTSPRSGAGAGVAYYGFTEGSGTLVEDTGGGTNSDGTVVLNGGSPPPSWSTDGPYV